MFVRKRPRIKVNLPGSSNGSPFTVRQLSSCGGLAEGDDPLGEEGAAVPAAIAVEGAELFAEIRITGVRSGNGKFLSGFTFVNLSPAAETLIHEYLAIAMLRELRSLDE